MEGAGATPVCDQEKPGGTSPRQGPPEGEMGPSPTPRREVPIISDSDNQRTFKEGHTFGSARGTEPGHLVIRDLPTAQAQLGLRADRWSAKFLGEEMRRGKGDFFLCLVKGKAPGTIFFPLSPGFKTHFSKISVFSATSCPAEGQYRRE